MSKLQDLINELCPDGVEYITLGEIANYSKERIDTNALNKNNYVSVENLLQNKQGKTVASSVPTEGRMIKYDVDDILIGNIRPYLKKIWLADCCGGTNGDVLVFQIKDKNIITPAFLYYVLSSDDFFDFDTQHSKGGKMPRGDKAVIMTYSVPIPPLEAQSEIVRILDTFTALIDNLRQERGLRDTQFAYYRDKLLTFDDSVPTGSLGEICDFVRGPFGGSLKKEIFKKSGYAVYEQQHAIYGEYKFRYYVDESKYNKMRRFQINPGDLIMSCSGTMGRISIIPSNAPQGIINQALLKLTAKSMVSNKYLKYYFESFISKRINTEAKGGAIKNVASVSVLKDIEIPVPPLAKQERIVNILDKFSALIENIDKEIELQQKQYEYYMDKLLTFKAVG